MEMVSARNGWRVELYLDEVADGGGAQARGEAGHALLSDDGLESADHARVELGGVQLDAGLDDVDGAQGAVRDAAAQAAGQGALEVVRQVVHGLLARGHRRHFAGVRGGAGLLGHAEDAERLLHIIENVPAEGEWFLGAPSAKVPASVATPPATHAHTGGDHARRIHTRARTGRERERDKARKDTMSPGVPTPYTRAQHIRTQRQTSPKNFVFLYYSIL